MKREKLIAAGLMSALIFTSLAASCSKNEPKTSERSRENLDAIREADESEESIDDTDDTETTVTDPITFDITHEVDPNRDYGHDFVGQVKVSDETADLYDDSDHIIKDGFTASGDYGYIYPYAATRTIFNLDNYTADVPDAEPQNICAGADESMMGFCTGDGTRITEPIYSQIECLDDGPYLYCEFSNTLAYIATDKNGKQSLISVDGKYQLILFSIIMPTERSIILTGSTVIKLTKKSRHPRSIYMTQTMI